MSKQIIFTQKNKAEFLDVEDAVLKPNQVKVKTIVSTISSGTERANITGNPTVSLESKPGDTVVFPRYSGYSASGIVVEKGEDVKNSALWKEYLKLSEGHKIMIVTEEESEYSKAMRLQLQEWLKR